MIGIITGSRIDKNRDGDANRRLIQVQMLDEDVRTVELVPLSGIDVNPANGCRVYAVESNGVKIGIAITDDLTPEVAAGEMEIYSTDSPATTKKARIKLGTDSVVTINQGTDFAVRFSALETAFNQLKSDYDAHTHPYTDTPVGPAVTSPPSAPSTADISGAKVDEVMIP